MSCVTWIGRALTWVLLAAGAAAQDGGALDLTLPDMSVPRAERDFRTCPDREARPAWAESLEGWEVERARLLSAIYEAQTFEAIVATGDCSCAVKAPPWDAAEAAYRQDYAALDLDAVREVRRELDEVGRDLRSEVRDICRGQGNW